MILNFHRNLLWTTFGVDSDCLLGHKETLKFVDFRSFCLNSVTMGRQLIMGEMRC